MFPVGEGRLEGSDSFVEYSEGLCRLRCLCCQAGDIHPSVRPAACTCRRGRLEIVPGLGEVCGEMRRGDLDLRTELLRLGEGSSRRFDDPPRRFDGGGRRSVHGILIQRRTWPRRRRTVWWRPLKPGRPSSPRRWRRPPSSSHPAQRRISSGGESPSGRKESPSSSHSASTCRSSNIFPDGGEVEQLLEELPLLLLGDSGR